MSIVIDLYGIKWGNPSTPQVRAPLVRLEHKPPEFTPEHWTRVETDLLRKIGRSASEQSRMTMPECLSEVPGMEGYGDKNPNRAANYAKFQAEQSMIRGGGSGTVYVATSAVGYVAQKSIKTPGRAQGELRALLRDWQKFKPLRGN